MPPRCARGHLGGPTHGRPRVARAPVTPTTSFAVRQTAPRPRWILTVDVFDEVGVWRVADPGGPGHRYPAPHPRPGRVHARTHLRLFQWLDDGVFALVVTGPNRSDTGALMVCTVSEPACEAADPDPADWILPDREFYE